MVGAGVGEVEEDSQQTASSTLTPWRRPRKCHGTDTRGDPTRGGGREKTRAGHRWIPRSLNLSMLPRSANSFHFAVGVQSDCPSLWKGHLQVPEMYTRRQQSQDVRLRTLVSAGCVVTTRRAWGRAGHLASPCPSLSCRGSRPITRRPGPQRSCGKSHTVLLPSHFVKIHLAKCISSWVSAFLFCSSPGSASAARSECRILLHQ